MKTKRFLACVMAGVLILSMAACSSNDDDELQSEAPDTVETDEGGETEPETDTKTEADASIDFEDGNYNFVQMYLALANSDESELAVVDYNGSKALEVTNTSGKVPYIGFDISSLLGEDLTKLSSIEMTMGISYADGSFSAVSGDVLIWSGGEEKVETAYDWSVYTETKNPKAASVILDQDEVFVTGSHNLMLITLDTDNGAAEHGNATFYIDDIRFLDADENLLTADQTAAFDAPDGYAKAEKDLSNLKELTDAVDLEGFVVSGDGWAQAGIDITEDMQSLLVPGSVIEIEYSSESGAIWLVITGAVNGWIRVGQEDAAINDSGNIAQITYEQIMEACGGADSSELTGQLQCESDTAWEVFAVRIGMGN